MAISPIAGGPSSAPSWDPKLRSPVSDGAAPPRYVPPGWFTTHVFNPLGAA